MNRDARRAVSCPDPPAPGSSPWRRPRPPAPCTGPHRPHYQDPVDLDTLSGIAGLSKYHFLRLFKRTYGRTPGAYLSERRVERAQDLLRSTNLSVTEVCFAVGFSSLGSFSSRFSAITGETPREFQRRYAVDGAPRIPGCYVFMWGLAERRDAPPGSSAIQEKPGSTKPRLASSA